MLTANVATSSTRDVVGEFIEMRKALREAGWVSEDFKAYGCNTIDLWKHPNWRFGALCLRDAYDRMREHPDLRVPQEKVH